METTLNDWLNGREREHAVRQVMRELEGVFGPAGEIPCQLLARALAVEPDDPARLAYVTEAVQMIGRHTRRKGDESA